MTHYTSTKSGSLDAKSSDGQVKNVAPPLDSFFFYMVLHRLASYLMIALGIEAGYRWLAVSFFQVPLYAWLWLIVGFGFYKMVMQKFKVNSKADAVDMVLWILAELWFGVAIVAFCTLLTITSYRPVNIGVLAAPEYVMQLKMLIDFVRYTLVMAMVFMLVMIFLNLQTKLKAVTLQKLIIHSLIMMLVLQIIAVFLEIYNVVPAVYVFVSLGVCLTFITYVALYERYRLLKPEERTTDHLLKSYLHYFRVPSGY